MWRDSQGAGRHAEDGGASSRPARSRLAPTTMFPDSETAYRALRARDPRFDGRFFVGVSSTGIYCRPVCPARTPRADRCSFYRSAAAAESAGFRACLRCRPELAPGLAPMDATGRLVAAAAERIERGALDRGTTGELAGSLGVGERQLRRAFEREVGSSPSQLARARRLGLARQLLTETDLRLDDVAAAAGFSSTRRFQSALRSAFGRSASELRGKRSRGTSGGQRKHLELSLSYRAPLHVPSLLRFLHEQRLPGVDRVRDGVYERTVGGATPLGWRTGVVRLRFEERDAKAQLEIPVTLVALVRPVVRAMRHLFDLDADPATIDHHLRAGGLIDPGVRVPGAFDGFEVAVHAVLSQAVSVRAAERFCERLVARFGRPLDRELSADQPHQPDPELAYLPPRPEDLAAAGEDELRSIGLTGGRARALLAVANLAKRAPDLFEAVADPEERRAALMELPGIGPWTADYLALRLGDPDAFPASDLGLRRALTRAKGQRPTAREARRLAEPFRPWRSYAALHLWRADAAGS